MLAWKWAEGELAKDGAASKPVSDELRKSPDWLKERSAEAGAAVALYWLSGDKTFHERFKQVTELVVSKDVNYQGGWIEPIQQPDATFLYARLPAELTDPALQETARKRFVLAGNVAMHFLKGNSLDLATANPGMPMWDFVGYFTNPGMGTEIVRAHAVTGDPRLLTTIIASTAFSSGANPDNMAFTTGLGPNPVRNPLKLDSRNTGQPAPVGLTVFGPSDQADSRGTSGSSWVHQWVLTPERMTPASRTWPPPESYCDIFGWPAANEFCVNQPVASTAYVWGYLAASPRAGQAP
jgi:endoglucanase